MTGTVQVLAGREVPLGGLRAITVRRTLPHKERTTIGAWCFVDHYGPHHVGADGTGGMDVPPHPHTGLQTVSWLFSGEIEHRDSGGVVALVRPGELNLMTAGAGIAHSEVTTAATSILHGVQLWVALPEESRDGARGFDHYAPMPTPLPDSAGEIKIFLGGLPKLGQSPVPTSTRLLGAELLLQPNATVDLAIDPGDEHGVLLDRGSLAVDGTTLAPAELAYLAADPSSVRLESGPEGARLLLLGGEPFAEKLLMWWNFIGRTHEEIETYRRDWETGAHRFGTVSGYVGETDRIPAPPMPAVRLKPR